MKKNFEYRHLIALSLFLFSCFYAVFFCSFSYLRLSAAFLGFLESGWFYFLVLFTGERVFSPSVTQIPTLEVWTFLPFTAEAFAEKMANYWSVFFSSESLSGYFSLLANGLRFFLMYFMVFGVPAFLLLYLFWTAQVDRRNTDHFAESRFLGAARRAQRGVIRPVQEWILSVFSYFDALWEGRYLKLLLFIWLLNLNVITFVAEFLSWYLYIAAAFDFSTMYAQLYRFVLDVLIAFRSAPWPVWAGIGIYLFLRLRRAIGLRILYGHEAQNVKFIEDQPLVLMIVGTMGAKKTTLLTDIALSQETIFRERALEGLQECDSKFPEFPWLRLELELTRAVEHGEIKTLYSARKWVWKKRARYELNPTVARLFGYDGAFYGTRYNGGLFMESLWSVIETYSLLFLIYTMKTALCFSNISVRYDGGVIDTGNFPDWYQDFFEARAETQEEESHRAHILDFDALRLGKRMNETVESVYEFGTVLISEVDKDRKNSLELNDVKRSSEDANQKNDLFNAMLKMIRHPATVDFYPFARVVTDGQRPESWGADARELCNVVHVVDAKEKRLALPGYALEGLLHELIYPRFVSAYYRFRRNRGDNTFFMWAFKTLANALHQHDVRVKNQFGYCVAHLEVESGRMDGAAEERIYYLANKKIYSNRFSTDCYSSFFHHRTEGCSRSLDELPTYADTCASLEELQKQNSYFIADLMKIEKEAEKRK